MNFIIDLPENETRALEAKAHAHGISPEQYARQVIQEALAPDWLRQSWIDARNNGTDQLSMDEIDAEIAAARRARHAQQPQPEA